VTNAFRMELDKYGIEVAVDPRAYPDDPRCVRAVCHTEPSDPPLGMKGPGPAWFGVRWQRVGV
jgi:hypothetical protein